jgi:hypothetical protein
MNGIDPTAILQAGILAGVTWLVRLAIGISNQLGRIEKDLSDVMAWRNVHDAADERRFNRLERHVFNGWHKSDEPD